MEIADYGFQKSELLKTAERIYELSCNKQQLELALSSEEFHQKYIPQREKMVGARIWANFPIILVMLILYVVCIVFWIWVILYKVASSAAGICLLFSGLFMIYGFRLFCKLMKEESEMAVRFIHSKNPEKAMRFAKKHDINTFQDDKLRTEKKIANLKDSIARIDKEITELEERKFEIINDSGSSKRSGEVSDDKRVADPWDENADAQTGKSSFSFNLKEDDMKGADIVELTEYYNKEQDYILFGMKDLQFKLAAADKDIARVDEEIEIVKKRIFLFVVLFSIAAFAQGFIPGFIGGIYGAVCLVVGVIALFGTERACRGPIIRYLVENESKYVAEYCYKNNVVPIKQKKKELQILLQQQQDAIEDIKRKKQELENHA